MFGDSLRCCSRDVDRPEERGRYAQPTHELRLASDAAAAGEMTSADAARLFSEPKKPLTRHGATSLQSKA